MTSAQFTVWKAQLGLSIPAAAQALGISESSVSRYLSGSYMGARRDEAVTIPKHIELACAALALGITSYAGQWGEDWFREVTPQMRKAQ